MNTDSGRSLQVQDVSLSFGCIQVLKSVSLTIEPGKVVGIIGPNGAGKTSLLNIINGFYPASSGSVTFGATEMIGRRPSQIAELGISRTFQNIELVEDATALENLMIGRHRHIRYSLFSAAVFWGKARRVEVEHRRVVEDLVHLLGIDPLRNRVVGTLPAGQRKVIEIGRALASEPDLLLLDEPSSGMAREEKEDIARFILRGKRELGLTQVLIEHDIRFVSELCEEVYVLHFGEVIAHGPPEEVLKNPQVVAAYVGGSATSSSA